MCVSVLCRWEGLCQALSLHKCLFYFVHDNQIWVRSFLGIAALLAKRRRAILQHRVLTTVQD